MKLRYQTYTASDAEAITNVKQATVRNWRRAGYLGTQKGHARYDIRHLILMFLMGMLVKRGATPAAARDTAAAVSRGVFRHAVWCVEGFSEGALQEASKVLDQQIEEGNFDQQIESKDFETAGEALELPYIREAFLRSILADAASALDVYGKSSREPSWLVIWADGHEEYLYEHREYEEFFTDIEYTQDYVKGPVTLYCLGAMSKMLMEKLPYPAFDLDEPLADDDA